MNPITFVFRFANTLGNVYLAGQISWWLYKKYRELSKKKIASEELQARLYEIFQKKFQRPPTVEELDAVIEATGNKTWADRVKEFRSFVEKKIEK